MMMVKEIMVWKKKHLMVLEMGDENGTAEDQFKTLFIRKLKLVNCNT